jgi:hypothetical protein
MRALFAAGGLLASLTASAEPPSSHQPSPSPGRVILESRPQATPSPELCGLLARCGLPVDPAFCPPALSAGVNGVTYDESRCAEARDLRARGVAPDDPVARACTGCWDAVPRRATPWTTACACTRRGSASS